MNELQDQIDNIEELGIKTNAGVKEISTTLKDIQANAQKMQNAPKPTPPPVDFTPIIKHIEELQKTRPSITLDSERVSGNIAQHLDKAIKDQVNSYVEKDIQEKLKIIEKELNEKLGKINDGVFNIQKSSAKAEEYTNALKQKTKWEHLIVTLLFSIFISAVWGFFFFKMRDERDYWKTFTKDVYDDYVKKVPKKQQKVF